jgi:pimeloyl-ACP methyl ester carboxylesterase
VSSRPDTAPSPLPATVVRLLEGPAGRLRVHLTGDDAAPPVVAVHGVGATGRQFRRLAVELADRGLRSVALDRPGAGGSPAGDPRLPAQAAAALAAAATLAPGPALWVGHSWGAAVALEAALTDPGAVRGLVLLAPALLPFALPLPLRLAVSTPGSWTVRSILRLAGRPLIRGAMRHAYGPGAALIDHVAVTEELEGWRGQSFSGVAATVRVMEAELRALGPRAARLDPRIPVRLLLGEADPLTAAGAPRDGLRALLPGAAVEVLPRCGHVLHVTEAPTVADRVAAVVRAA